MYSNSFRMHKLWVPLAGHPYILDSIDFINQSSHSCLLVMLHLHAISSNLCCQKASIQCWTCTIQKWTDMIALTFGFSAGVTSCSLKSSNRQAITTQWALKKIRLLKCPFGLDVVSCNNAWYKTMLHHSRCWQALVFDVDATTAAHLERLSVSS